MNKTRQQAIVLFRKIRLSFWKSEINEKQFIDLTSKMLLSFLPKPKLAKSSAEKIVAFNLKHLPKINNPQNATANQRSLAYTLNERKGIKILCVSQTAELDNFLEG